MSAAVITFKFLQRFLWKYASFVGWLTNLAKEKKKRNFLDAAELMLHVKDNIEISPHITIENIQVRFIVAHVEASVSKS